MLPNNNSKNIANTTKPRYFTVKVSGLQVDVVFLSRVCLLLFFLVIVGFLATILNQNINNIKTWVSLLILFIGAIGCAGAWLSIKFSLAAWLIVAAVLLVNSLLFITDSDASFLETSGGFLLCAILALMLQGIRAAYAVVFVGNLATIFIWLTNGIFISKNGGSVAYKVGIDDLSIFILVQVMTIWLVNYLITKLVNANSITKAQAAQLEKALLDNEGKRQLGEDISQKVYSLAAELHATADQQALGSQAQVKALAEVIAFTEELTQTSQVIAGKANQLKSATSSIFNTTKEAKKVSLEAEQLSSKSAFAVKQTTEHNHQVKELYEILHETLSDLADSQGEIKSVVGIIQNLGNQTHLLSLNAAIEAVGAGMNGTRFKAVANQVKNLAERSVSASQQVTQILGLVQNRIERATTAALHGYEETQVALTVALESAASMSQLVTIIENNSYEMGHIEAAANLINQEVNEISYATQQQYSTSVEGVGKLQLIGTIAAQTATGSTQITSSTLNLEELVRQVLFALTKTDDS